MATPPRIPVNTEVASAAELPASPSDTVHAGSPALRALCKAHGYVVLEELAKGGAAVVYRGTQTLLDRPIALKVLRSQLVGSGESMARFEREARTIASLQHENIITLHDFFCREEILVLALEYVEGVDLYDLLQRCGTIPAHNAAIIALQLARGLDHAHFRGIIHRDVKPANVVISKLGEVKLTDFGIARIDQSDLTETGFGLGTPSYMSPEQVVGDPIDHRSDIWSLGVVLYQAITGQKPFVERSDKSVLQSIRLDQPTPPRKITVECPRELERIVMRCLEKSPNARYAAAHQLVIALERYLFDRVRTDYRATLAAYLRKQGIVSVAEGPTSLGASSYLLAPLGWMGRARLSRRFRHAYALGLALCLALGGVVGWRLAAKNAGRLGGRRALAANSGPSETLAVKGRGFLHLVVYPWAHVQIDDRPMLTTPQADPIALPPGPHNVRLLNPYFESASRRIVVETNKTAELHVALTPLPENK